MGVRYSEVQGVHAREIVLLKSFPCCYGKCSFCNYIEDNSQDEDFMNRVNQEVLEEVNGKYGILEVINSGSVFELPQKTLEKIRDVVYAKAISVVYFEVFYSYLPRLDSLVSFFNEHKEVEIRFRMGMETFDNTFRKEVYHKNFYIKESELENLSQKIYSVCLLIGTKGQSKEMITRDIELGLQYFRALTINVFIENGTPVKRDEALIEWFVKEKRELFRNNKIEILIDNKDLGVYEQ